MKNPKSIFFLVYFLFHAALLIVSIYVNYNSEDFEFLLYLRGKMSLMVWVSGLGLVFFAINMLLVGIEKKSTNKEKSGLEQEVNALKAKMFDLQEATTRSTKNAPQETEAEDQSDKNNSETED